MKEVQTKPREFDEYIGVVPNSLISEIKTLASGLQGLKVTHINATEQGGGVAEILHSLIPLFEDLGIAIHWYALPPPDSLGNITKILHHSLQGSPDTLDEQQIQDYLAYNVDCVDQINGRLNETNVLVVHDPQVLPMIDYIPESGHTVWNCHLDTSHPNKLTQKALFPFVTRYDKVIFSSDHYVFQGLEKDKIKVFPPAIDPLINKNAALPAGEAKLILSKVGIDISRPLITQVSRFDKWKDPWGVIDAFRIARKSIPGLQLALLGVMAAMDDPDAPAVLKTVTEYAGGDPDIHIYYDPDQIGDFEVNAFQAASDIILQKSTREGFGLTVAEAMWKGTPVIGGDCDGIHLQITDGETGIIVGSPQECAEKIVELLNNPEMALRLGQAGKESMQHHFLIPCLLRNHLRLYHDLVHGESGIPVCAPVESEWKSIETICCSSNSENGGTMKETQDSIAELI